MNFQVPQFIETKAKIIGTFTLEQAGYIAVAAVFSLIAYYYLNFFLFLLVAAVLGTGSLALGFGKVAGQPLPRVLLSAFTYTWGPRTYTWQRVTPEATLDTAELEKIEFMRRTMSIQGKLKSIALGVMTGKLLGGGDGPPGERYQVVTYMTGERKLAKRVDYSR